MVHDPSPSTASNLEPEKAASPGFLTFAQELHHRARAFLKARNVSHLIKQELAFRLGKISADYQAQLRKVLQQRLNVSPIQLYRFFQTSMGEDLLTRFSYLIQLQGDSNDKYALRDALVQTSADPRGGSVLSFLRKFSADIQLNIDRIALTIQQVDFLVKETEVLVEAIRELAGVEAAAEPPVDFSSLPDIRGPGEYSVDQQTLLLADASREFPPGTLQDRQFRVILYKPQPWRPGKAPVIVISHGLGSSPDDFEEYARHLTSHGYVVAIPQHPGSDATQIQYMLTGDSKEVFQLQEFIDRPLDVTHVLDELERRNQSEFEGRLNLKAVGVMGHSFGAYTALALAGAEIDFEKLEQACGPLFDVPNLSLLLQCRALGLPRQTYNCRDRRVKAILPVDPVGSEVFGPKGLSQVKIPVLIMAGSEDRTAPTALEQIRIFPWLTTPDRYLALIKGKAHFGNFSKLKTQLKLMLLKTMPHVMGPDLTIFYNYAYATSLAFFEVYIGKNDAYRPYLQSSYAQYMSQVPFSLYLISTTSVQRLTQVIQDFCTKAEKFSLRW